MVGFKDLSHESLVFVVPVTAVVPPCASPAGESSAAAFVVAVVGCGDCCGECGPAVARPCCHRSLALSHRVSGEHGAPSTFSCGDAGAAGVGQSFCKLITVQSRDSRHGLGTCN